MDSDKALELLGDRSPWKFFYYFIVSLPLGFLAGWHMLSITFIGMQSPYLCQLPEGVSVNDSIPEVTKLGVTSLDSCHIWSNYSAATNKTVGCPQGWSFEDKRIYTIVNEWTLVCDRGYLVETSQMVLVFGVMVGAVITTILADRFGRKSVVTASMVSISVVGLITSAMPNYISFTAMRFITGFFQQGIVLAGFVYIIELFPATQRTILGLFTQCFWATGMGIMALLAWLLPNWRHFNTVISLPGLLCLGFIWLIPESVPWLCAKKRYLEAKHVLKRAAKISKVTLPMEFQLTVEEKALLKQQQSKNLLQKLRQTECCSAEDVAANKQGTNYTIMDIVRSKKLFMSSLIMCYLWCANGLVYYGLSLSTGTLAGNPYVNFCLSGLVEIPAYVIAAYALNYIGRRWTIFAFHIIAGVSLIATLFIPSETADGTNLTPLIITLAMIGKFGITGSYGSIFLYAPELFPTTVRNIGMGIASVGSRVGNIVAPFSSYVARQVWWLPNIVFGVMAIVGGLLTLILPETLNRALPQTIEEVERWPRTLTKEEKQRHKAEVRAMKELKEMRKNGSSEEGSDVTKPLHTDNVTT